MSQEELLSKIVVLLGGRVADKIMFSHVTTGAGNDLMRATDIVRAMVSEYGMGETLGLATYPKQSNPVFLNAQQPFSGAREYSEQTASKLDAEIKSILDQPEMHVAELLLKKEVLNEEDFKGLLNSQGD
jgi:cell division protease FtsH